MAPCMHYDHNPTTKRLRLDYAGKPPSTKRLRRLYDHEEVQQTNKASSRRLDEFEMLNKIGEGSYGVLQRARDNKTLEIVAVKKMKTATDNKQLGFRPPPEIDILASQNPHPSIIHLKHAAAAGDDGVFMVMEYVEKQPFTLSQVKCLVQQLLQGVAYLHHIQC